ncbi:MAG: hypothetical protein IJP98_02325 [Clostridia bacterium]|nr:hypothetical protein [Clostridia bacterium]
MNPILQKAYNSELKACRRNLEYFIETWVKIEDKDAPGIIVPFRLWEAQKKALYSINENRLNIILKARQLGITWLVLAYAVWCMLQAGITVVALSRTETEAKELVRRVSVILNHMRGICREKEWGGMTWSSTALSVTMTNPDEPESTFQAFASTPGAGRSFTANLIILDEWAFQQFADKIWVSAYPTVSRPTSGKVIGLSTIKRGTLFEKIWTEVEDFNRIFIPWSADPRRTPEWYERQKRVLGEKVLAEFPATPEEAFTVVGGVFFEEVRAHIHLVDYLPQGVCRRYISLDYGLDKLAAYWHRVDDQGFDIVYREIAKSGLIASEAAAAIKAANGTEEIDAIYAPPDLWNLDRHTGRSTAEIFSDCGLPMTQTSNDRVQGWLDLKEWLSPIEERDVQTGETRLTARMRFLRNACPYLWRCLLSIQKDEREPNDCAKYPHELTHGPDALRAFAAGRPMPGEQEENRDPLGKPDYEDQVNSFFAYDGGF